jgi:hypothetical protein
MTGYTDYWGRKLLDLTTGKAGVSTPTISVALFSAVGSDSGSGFTELSGSGYARVTTAAANWNSAGGSAPCLTSNGANLVFPTASGTWSSALAWGLYDASTLGNLLFWDYLGLFPWIPFTCTLASPGVLDAPGHGYANADSAVVSSEFGGALPTTAGSWAGLLPVAGVSGDTFNLGVNTTSTGNGMVRKVLPVVVPAGSAFVFTGGTPGNLQLTLA